MNEQSESIIDELIHQTYDPIYRQSARAYEIQISVEAALFAQGLDAVIGMNEPRDYERDGTVLRCLDGGKR